MQDYTDIMAKSKDDEVHCGSWQMMAGMVRNGQNGKRMGVRHGKNVT